MSIAEPLELVEKKENEKLSQAAWGMCKDIAKSEKILDDFYETLYRCGITGEEKAAKLLYLAVKTRLFDREVNIGVKGPRALENLFRRKRFKILP